MGGYGSTRWGNTPIRWQTGECLALEVAKIRPYLSGSQSLVWRWRRPPGDDATLSMETSRKAVALSYTTQRGQGVSMSIREHIAVAWMPCTYGGERAWFTCPGCDRRAGALYLPLTHDRFRCRHCHKLAYGSQQVTPEERHWLRSRAIQRRLGADGAAIAPWHRPTRPKGMHARTYTRLCDALLDHEREREAILTVQLRRLVARADRLRATGKSGTLSAPFAKPAGAVHGGRRPQLSEPHGTEERWSPTMNERSGTRAGRLRGRGMSDQ